MSKASAPFGFFRQDKRLKSVFTDFVLL